MPESGSGEKWRLKGYDAFDERECSFYPLPGEWESEERVREAAKTQLETFQKSELPAELQDQVFIVKPDGDNYRYLG